MLLRTARFLSVHVEPKVRPQVIFLPFFKNVFSDCIIGMANGAWLSFTTTCLNRCVHFWLIIH